MCAAQCKRFLTSPPPAAPPAASNSSSSRPQSELLSESLEAADDYAAVYALTLDVNDGAKGGQREVQHGDDLALLAAQLLLEASSLVVEEPPSDAASAAGHSKANELLLDAASLLEFALGHSPYSAHLKVLLLEAYDKLGAFEAGVRLFNQLGVKHVQADTLSYLVTGPCVRSGLLVEASRQCGEVLRFHRAARRDAGDYSVKALESGNYSKAVEIAEFQRDKLDASASLALAQALKPGLALAQSNHTLPEARALLAEANARKDAPALWTREAVAKLSLNWDLDVKLHWENRSPEEGEVKKALSLELRSRAALVRLLHHALESSAPNLASELPHLNAAAAEAEALEATRGARRRVTSYPPPKWALSWRGDPSALSSPPTITPTREQRTSASSSAWVVKSAARTPKSNPPRKGGGKGALGGRGDAPGKNTAAAAASSASSASAASVSACVLPEEGRRAS
mmetsp:Transcript_32019/g.72126  ORF Transcript_32019/g.72126 Transcript_32019/m.72126 type:complete len:458 (-) Transcript_32019:670-2043(-)